MRLLLLLNPSPWNIIKGDQERGTRHGWQHWDHFRLIFRRRVMRMHNAVNIVTGASKGDIIRSWCDLTRSQHNRGADDQTPQWDQAGMHTAICTHRGGAEAAPSAQSCRNQSQLSDHMDKHPFLVLFLKLHLKKKRVSALQKHYLKKIFKNVCVKDPEQQHRSRCLEKSGTPHILTPP